MEQEQDSKAGGEGKGELGSWEVWGGRSVGERRGELGSEGEGGSSADWRGCRKEEAVATGLGSGVKPTWLMHCVDPSGAR